MLTTRLKTTDLGKTDRLHQLKILKAKKYLSRRFIVIKQDRFSRLRIDQIVSVASIAIVLIAYGSIMGETEKSPIIFPLTSEVFSVPTHQVPIHRSQAGELLIASEELEPASGSAQSYLRESLYNQLEQDQNLLTASAAALIDLGSQAILYEKNISDRLLPASTTKLMTAIVARELFSLDDLVFIEATTPRENETVIFYQGEALTVDDLLKAMLIQSSNKAALLLTELHPQGHEGFLSAMNEKAREYRLEDTNFENVVGYDSLGQVSSAHDLVELSRIFMSDPILREIVGLKSTVINKSENYSHQLYTTHYLLARNPFVVGIKTGTTLGAGEVLITQIERDEKKLLVILLGSKDRYNETELLINWALDRFVWLTIDDLES